MPANQRATKAYSFVTAKKNRVDVYNVRAFDAANAAPFARAKWVRSYAVVNDQFEVPCDAAYAAPSAVRAANF
jgi:hypothetical protein